MKKYLTLICLIIFSFNVYSQNNNSYSHQGYYYSNNESIFWIEDFTSANIIISNVNHYDQIVKNLMDIFSNPSDLIYYDNEDDNIIIYSNNLPSFNKDSLISLISIDTNDISFFTYSKMVNNSHIWLRNEVLVRFKQPMILSTLEQQLSNFENIQIFSENNNEYSIICKNEQDLIEISNILYDTNNVYYSCPDFYGTGSLNTNDTYYSDQWGLNNSGGTGTANVDINAPEAWTFINALGLNYGGNIKIAIIDDGIEPHEDLYENGISKVLEGYTANGNGTGRPCSNCKHGMGSAGIIAATHNEIGVAGVSPNVKIVPIRIFKKQTQIAAIFGDDDPMFSNKNIAKAIRKSWEEFGCSVLSNSWSQNYHHDVVKYAINDALEYGRNGLGCIWVNSSGNNNQSSVNFPARYYDKIIVVGAINRYAERGKSDNVHEPWVDPGSCYGVKLDVVAPGTNIATIDREGNAGYSVTNYDSNFDGTSAACPFVSGIAALILTVNPNLTNQQVSNIIESTTKKMGGFNYQNTSGRNNGTWHEEVGYGLVDAYSAVKKALFGNGGSIIGNPSIDVCEILSYNYLGQELPSSVLIEWETSPNFAIISGQGTNNVTIRVISTTELNPYIKINFYSNNVLIHTLSKSVTITGNLIYPSILVSNTTINQNTIWNSEGFLGVNVTIENNATLTISNTLHISNNAKIIVKPGGKLIIDGGTLTNYCSNTPWQGIVIEGNSNQPQMGTSSNQGVVVVKNNAIIENAICGIKLGDTTDLSKNGGIVYATNSTFKNCKNAVLFAPYRNMNNNVEFANRSKFTECNFLVNNDFYTSGMFFDSHAKLLGVNGISFTGCSFTNTQTNLNPSARSYASSGISAINSGFIVKPKCFSNVISGEVCTAPYINVPSLFSGLDYAIVAVAVDHKNQISVLSSEFYKNDYGIFISGEDNPKILNNAFTIGKDNNNIINRPNGIYLQNSTGFRIEENKFYNNTTSTLDKIGLRIKNCRYDNNQVYNNYFYNLKIGQQFTGLNYNYPTVTDEYAEGLVSVCNKNYSNLQSDIQVELYTQGRYSGINPYQTYHTTINGEDVKCGANNLFTDPTKIVLQYDNNGVFINYYYNTNEALYQPTKFIGIQPIVSEYENSCPSKIFGLYPSTINAQLAAINVDYANIRYNYNQIIDAGNTEELLDLIQGKWSDDVWKLRSELISKSPYLSQEAIYSVAMKNLLPPALLLEICLANPDATKREDFLDNLRYKIPNPLPEYMINLIKASWNQKTLRTELEEELSAFKTYRDEYQTYKTEILLSDTIYNYTDIINHLGSRGSFSDYLSMAEIAINQDDYIQANLYLDILENNSEKLSEEEATEIASFRDYISIRETIFLDSTNIYNLDSIQIATLESYASSNNYRGAILARNILCFLYDICIDDVPAPPKMLRIGVNTQSVKNTTLYIASVKVLPNPANSYVSFIWDMKSYDQPAILFIYDQTGKTVMTKEIENAQGQWIWDLKNTPSGVYVYTLKSDQLILFSGKVIVNK